LVIGGGAGAAPSTTTTGTGVVTALGVNTGTAGAFVVNGGALGTPSSGTVTNLTGTASININGTVGATTASTGAFSTLSATGTLSGGTSGTAYSFSGSAPATSLTLDSSGRLLVGGTASPASVLHLYSSGQIGTIESSGNYATTGSGYLRWKDVNGNAGFVGYGGNANNFDIYNGLAGAITFSTSGSERARIDSSGNLLVGTTSAPSYSSKLRVQGGIETQGTNQYNIVATSSGSDFEWVLRSGSRQLYYVANATVVANLSAAGVWTNASDARYKENIVDSQYGLSTVMALKPRLYNLIDQADKPQVGFIAQEVIDVVPEVVESIHNSVTGEDRYTFSYGNLVAVLTKAIQEQNQLITQLTARITALESA